MAKLFFALPAEALAADIVAWRDQLPWPGQPVPAANLHLTLAFLGEANEATTAQLMAAVERQHCPPLTIALNETGWFGRAKAAWIGPREWPNELTVLARALRRHGEKLGLGNGEQGYRPHVTLSRKASEPPALLPAPISCCGPTDSASINPSRPRTGCATSPSPAGRCGPERRWHPDRLPCPDSSIKRAIP